MTEKNIKEKFIKLKAKGHLTNDEYEELYSLADILLEKYKWNINDEAFIGMYEDDEWYNKFRK